MFKILQRSLIFVVGFLILQIHLYGQENFMKGYIITNDKDTVQGLIDYRNWPINPDEIVFKQSINSEKTRYKPLEINSFFVNNEHYVAATVDVEIIRPEIGRSPYIHEFDSYEVTTFLKTVIEGYVSLYHYKSNSIYEQYYLYKNEKFNRLIYRKYLKEGEKGKEYLFEDNAYRKQLYNHLSDCPSIKDALPRTRFNRNSLVNILTKYHQCINKVPSFKMVKEKTTFDIGVIGGATITQLRFNSSLYSLRYLTENDFPTSISYSAGVFLEIILPRSQRKWSLLNEFMVSNYKVNGLFQDDIALYIYSKHDVEFDLTYFKLYTSLRYSYPMNKSQLFINVGLGNGFLQVNTNNEDIYIKRHTFDSTEQKEALESVRPVENNIVLGAGWKFNRISVELRGEIGNGIANDTELRSLCNRYHLLVGLRINDSRRKARRARR